MSKRSATHGTFTLERVYDAAPARVFKAWADPTIKARWFVGPADWQLLERAIDFRVGGTERLSGRKGSGIVSTFDAGGAEWRRGHRVSRGQLLCSLKLSCHFALERGEFRYGTVDYHEPRINRHSLILPMPNSLATTMTPLSNVGFESNSLGLTRRPTA